MKDECILWLCEKRKNVGWLVESNHDSNELYFCVCLLCVSMYTNTMSKELFGASQRIAFFLCCHFHLFKWYQFLHDIAKKFRDLNSMIFDGLFFLNRVIPIFYVVSFSFAIFFWLCRSPSKKLCSRQFYSYFSCRCCEHFYCSYLKWTSQRNSKPNLITKPTKKKKLIK